MDINYLYIFIILFLNILCQNNTTNHELNPNNSPNNEFESIYRIDSITNHLSITIEGEDIVLSQPKGENKQHFLITSTFSNSYFIISKEGKRLGVDELNRMYLYKLKDKENIEKTYWNIIKYNNSENIYLIQNVYNGNFLEIKPENKKFRCKNTYFYDPTKKIDKVKDTAKFYFFRLYEEVQIRPIDIEKLRKEPIDVFMKYTDYTDKNLNRTGIHEKIKKNDMEELKYSLRSILKYIPWVRKIFIVMPNEKVRFLKPYDEIKDKFVYIKEKDVIGFDTLNSAPLQFNLFQLEKYGISENFIYMDDNYFIGEKLQKSDFFYYDEESKKIVPAVVNNYLSELNNQDILNEYNELFKKKDTLDINDFLAWKLSILSSLKLIIDNYKYPLISVEFTHCSLPLNIQDLKEIHSLISTKYKYADETLKSKDRNVLNLQPQILFSLYELNVKKRRVHSIEYNHLGLSQVQTQYLYIKLIGINTGGPYSELHEKGKKVLKSRFNYPHKYEIDYAEKVNKNEKEKIRDEEQSTYINKTELKIIEDLFKSELRIYYIFYWGLIVAISLTMFAISYYIFKINKKGGYCCKYNYIEIKQDEN